ncbi:MAG: DUF4347 domain-containing protein, partial [Nitrospirota bacterium]|nr:DUF4347 domain-containing protein [Nitrospirota bacterium]
MNKLICKPATMDAVKEKKPDTAKGKPSAVKKKKSPPQEEAEASSGMGMFFALEPRIMFDGAALATGAEVIQDTTTQDQTPIPGIDGETSSNSNNNDSSDSDALWSSGLSLSAPSDRKEIVFIDTSVDNYQTLMEGIDPNAEVILLDSTRDGIEQIAEILGERTDIDAVHIISHGDSGELHLGTGVLDAASMQGEYADELSTIKQALTDEADFLIYGCNFGEGASGSDAATLLSALTGADVAASSDLTGAEALGGDWDLEVQTGIIESDVIIDKHVQETYAGVLDITTGLVANWTFDADATDSSGNSYDGTLTNGATIDATDSTDIVGEGKLSLDGTDDYVDLNSHATTIGSLSEGTIAAWIRTSATGVEQTIFSLSDTADSNSYASLRLTAADQLFFAVRENGTLFHFDSTATNLADGNWHHVVVTVSATGNNMYIDGSAVAVTYVNGNASSTNFLADVTSADTLAIGKEQPSTGPQKYFDGLIDDVRVYDRALTSADIDELFATSNPLVVDTTSDVADGDTSSISALLGSKGADGFISLREAIEAANNTLGTDTISFDISDPLVSGAHTIDLLSALPDITDAIIIDGTSEPDYAGTPIIELNGTSAGAGVDGLRLVAGSDGSTIQGLVINRFGGDGIEINNSDNNIIAGNYIGTDVTGLVDLGNGLDGIRVDSSTNTLIGGSTVSARNIISGNSSAGIRDFYSTGTTILGNYIGVDATGIVALGNSGMGISLWGGSNAVVGGSGANEGNVISGNSGQGILLYSGSGHTIQGNYIGTDTSGTIDLGNLQNGIVATLTSMNNLIGGTGAGEGNVIAFNSLVGVAVSTGSGNSILGNAIYSNDDLGIDLGTTGVTANDAGDADTGGNLLQNYPVLTTVNTTGGQVSISGTLNSTASTTFRIEFYASAAADGTGYGEAERFLGYATVTTDGSGNATINETQAWAVTSGEYVTATATKIDNVGQVGIDDALAYGNTSEFSQNVVANTGPVNTVPGAQTVNEDTSLAISGISVADSNTNLTSVQLSVTNGTLNVTLSGAATISAGANDSSTLTLSGNQA